MNNTNFSVDRTERDPSIPRRGVPETEMDLYELTHESGLKCRIARNRTGVLCGYVNVPAGHRRLDSYWLGLRADSNVHGGETYRRDNADGSSWVGFDCAHHADFIPLTDMASASMLRDGESERVRNSGLIYRDVDYVAGELDKLARTIASEQTGVTK